MVTTCSSGAEHRTAIVRKCFMDQRLILCSSKYMLKMVGNDILDLFGTLVVHLEERRTVMINFFGGLGGGATKTVLKMGEQRHQELKIPTSQKLLVR